MCGCGLLTGRPLPSHMQNIIVAPKATRGQLIQDAVNQFRQAAEYQSAVASCRLAMAFGSGAAAPSCQVRERTCLPDHHPSCPNFQKAARETCCIRHMRQVSLGTEDVHAICCCSCRLQTQATLDQAGAAANPFVAPFLPGKYKG